MQEFLSYFCLDSRNDTLAYTAAWMENKLCSEWDAISLADQYRTALNKILKEAFGFNPDAEYVAAALLPIADTVDALVIVRERKNERGVTVLQN